MNEYSLVDEITYKLALEAPDTPTATAILGPFFRPDTKWRKNGDNVVAGVKGGEMVFMHGQVFDFVTKKPLVNATVEMWEASTNGLYEQQDPEQEEHNLRGRFKTDEDGRYYWYCLRPTPYPVPDDGMKLSVLPYERPVANHGYRPCWETLETYGQTSVQTCSYSHNCMYLSHVLRYPFPSMLIRHDRLHMTATNR